MLRNYVDVLKVSLESKIQILEKITSYNEQQAELFKQENADLDMFDQMIEEKDTLIQEIVKLDAGFETLYKRISRDLLANKEKYAPHIKEIQRLIAKVMDLSVSIQAQEARNKNLIEQYFQGSRQKCESGRKSSKAAANYYKNMSKIAVNTPQFLDTKK